MDKICEEAVQFLKSILEGFGLSLNVAIEDQPDACRVNIEGDDADLLVAQGGELLNALEHLVNQAFIRKLQKGQRIVCDARSFRASREAELRAMASHAAERVRSTGEPFTFGPMSASERRIIHLSLAESQDLHTESLGEGSARRLRVSSKTHLSNA